ncbi:MAG: FAD-binding oxidoreductase [Bdellovibrionales bacterium]|nr:FAD-binding oxidoreductase [Oligoflexia bacterium]
MHTKLGWQVDVLDVKGIQSKAPFIDKTDDLAGALFGVKDGLLNPNRLKEHYREEAVKLGVKFQDSVWVLERKEHAQVHLLEAFQFKDALDSVSKKSLLTSNPKNKHDFDLAKGQFLDIEAGIVINAAGAWAPELAKILGYESPSKPVRRQISLFHARDLDLTQQGMIIDPSGVYFHPEAIYGLAGFATQNEPPGFNFDYDGEHFFQEAIWPALYERGKVFESLKHVSGWAGLYENSPDHHAIIGKVEGAANAHPIYEAHSFSGHGAMQSYGVGIALAELIVMGRYETLDLHALAGSRFKEGRTVASETWVI